MGTAAFVLGLVVQCLVLTRGRFESGDLKRAGWALVGAAAGLLPGKHEHGYDVHLHFLGACVAFAAVFAFQMRERILPYINSTLVLAVSLVNAYFLLDTLPDHHPLLTVWLVISVLPSVMVAVDALAGVRPNRGWQVTPYCWYLVLVVVLGIASMTFEGFAALLRDAGRGGDPRQMFLSGAVLAYLAVHAAYFVGFIRPPGRSESMEQRREVWRKDEQSFDRHYLEASGQPLHAWIVLVLVGGALGANAIGRWAPAYEVVRAAIGLLPLTASWMVPPPDALDLAATPTPRRRHP